MDFHNWTHLESNPCAAINYQLQLITSVVLSCHLKTNLKWITGSKLSAYQHVLPCMKWVCSVRTDLVNANSKWRTTVKTAASASLRTLVKLQSPPPTHPLTYQCLRAKWCCFPARPPSCVAAGRRTWSGRRGSGRKWNTQARLQETEEKKEFTNWEKTNSKVDLLRNLWRYSEVLKLLQMQNILN